MGRTRKGKNLPMSAPRNRTIALSLIAVLALPAPAEALWFANCTEARAAGYSNIQRGQPGYAPKLDRDNDGIACESGRRSGFQSHSSARAYRYVPAGNPRTAGGF